MSVQAESKKSANFLIVLMGSIGDVARGLALVSQIKNQMPGSRISWLVEPKSLGLLECNHLIDRIIVFKRSDGLRALPSLVRELKAERYDYCFDLQRHFKSGLFSLLSGAVKRIGFNRRDSKEFNWLFNNHWIEHIPAEHPKIEDYFLFLKKIGLKVEETPDFGLQRTAQEVASQEMVKSLGADYIGIVLGSSWHSKDWTLEGYYQLISNLLKERKDKIVLLGDRSQLQNAASLIENIKDVRLVDYCGKTTIRELVGVIGKAHFCVGPDSGPGHIAAGLGVPYVSLFGPTSAIKTAPFGCADLVVKSKLACAPCYRRECPGLNKLCMRLISVKSVLTKISAIE